MAFEIPNSCNCENSFESLCFNCYRLERSIEQYAIESALNMGKPDIMGCGHCGFWYDYEDFFEHPCVKNADP